MKKTGAWSIGLLIFAILLGGYNYYVNTLIHQVREANEQRRVETKELTKKNDKMTASLKSGSIANLYVDNAKKNIKTANQVLNNQKILAKQSLAGATPEKPNQASKDAIKSNKSLISSKQDSRALPTQGSMDLSENAGWGQDNNIELAPNALMYIRGMNNAYVVRNKSGEIVRIVTGFSNNDNHKLTSMTDYQQ